MRRLEAAVFLSGAALMGLEIAGSRVLAPVFGTSVFVWGALITTFLASLSVGYAVGGRLADRWPDARLLAALLAAAGVFVWVPCFRPEPLLLAFSRFPTEDRFQALLAAVALFAVPSILMGAVTPFAVRLRMRDVASAGRAAGRLSAISTAGSILGAFSMAFVLIPVLPLGPIVFGLGASLVLSALLAHPTPRLPHAAAATGLLAAAGSAFLLVPAPVATPVPGGKVVFQKETAYHRLQVVEQGPRRALFFDNRLQGWVPIDPATRLARNYVDGLLAAASLRPFPPRRTLAIGLGAGMIPSFLSRNVPGCENVSVEIDPEVVRVARDYFGFTPGARNRVVVGDGRRELSRMEGTFDVIFVDAFFADSLPFHLVTKEFYELCSSKLAPDGVLALNFVGLLAGDGDALFWSAYRTLQQVFPRQYVLCGELAEGKKTFVGNALLLATKTAVRISREEFVERTADLARRVARPEIGEWGELLYDGEVMGAGLPILTDAYAPTDALQHLVRR